MENLWIETQPFTPLINFRYDKGYLEVSGLSHPRHPTKFYKPILKWLDSYLTMPAEHTEIVMKLKQYDMESAKVFFQIISKFCQYKSRGGSIVVKWFYEEENMLEAGQDLSDMVGLPFEFIATGKI